METNKTPETTIIDFVETSDEIQCVFLKRMDTLACTRIEKEFTETISGSGDRKIILDVEKVDYVASSFLRLCVIASKVGKGKLTIKNTQPPVRKVLKIAGFESVAEIV